MVGMPGSTIHLDDKTEGGEDNVAKPDEALLVVERHVCLPTLNSGHPQQPGQEPFRFRVGSLSGIFQMRPEQVHSPTISESLTPALQLRVVNPAQLECAIENWPPNLVWQEPQTVDNGPLTSHSVNSGNRPKFNVVFAQDLNAWNTQLAPN